MQLILLKISLTHLLSRKKQTVTAALGVTLGIAAYIIMMSFMTGLNKLLDDMVMNTAPHIHVYNEIKPSNKQPLNFIYEDGDEVRINSVKPKNSTLSIHNAIPLIKALKKDNGIKGVAPLVNAQVFYLQGAIQLNGIVKGIDVKQQVDLFSFNDYVIHGNSNDLRFFENGIILGAGVAKKMAVGIGDNIQVSTATGALFLLKVVGVHQTGLAEVDDMQSFTNLKTAQKLIGQNDTYITDLYLRVNDLAYVVSKTKEIVKTYDISAVDFYTLNAQYEAGTSIRNIISYAVSAVLLLVAGFGIYNILNMLIYEKMNDIAILKAIGFSGLDVKKIFITQAMLIGFFGGVLGLAVGGAVSLWIDYIPFEMEALPTIKTYPVWHNPMYYITGIVFALISTFLAGYLPANKAQKIDPVDIIRGQ